jgi:HAD superfamily hydrolase (TIGR01484 family)
VHYKAVITDLDGTAVDSPEFKVVSNRLAVAVAQLEAIGIKVCAATGRPESFAMPVIASMNLTEPCIIASGTRIIDPRTRKELWSCDLSLEQTRAVVEVAQQQEYGYLWNDYVEDDYRNGGWQIADFQLDDPLYFFEICYVPEDTVEEVLTSLAHIEGIAKTVVIAQRPGFKDIHVTNATATKEHAIHELERLIGVKGTEMIGIGDGHNDLHLFNAVGHKVAMGNAVPELKAVADEVIGDIKDDGLAAYFEKLAETGGKLA